LEKDIYSQFFKLEQSHWWFRGMYGICFDLFKRWIAPGIAATDIVVDLGCGNGTWSRHLTRYGSVIGLDYSAEALANCSKRGLDLLVLGDAARLPLGDGEAAVVTALGLIEHLEDDRIFLKELYRVLRPGGQVLLLTSAYSWLWGHHDDLVHHKRRYTRQSFSRLLEEEGFQLNQVSYANTLLFPPILMARLLEKIGVRKGKAADGDHTSPDLFMPPRSINSILIWLLRLESLWLKWMALPFGVSLFAVITRRSDE